MRYLLKLNDQMIVLQYRIWHGLCLALATLCFRIYSLIPYSSKLTDSLILAPQDLRTADATNAADIYAGHLIFAGQSVEAKGQSPFALYPPSKEWAEELYGFSWLRHLRASGMEVSRSHARTLINDWIAMGGGVDDIGIAPHIAARRVLSWLSHSPFLLEGADRQFYKRFMRALMKDVRRLYCYRYASRGDFPRFHVALALCAAGLSLANYEWLKRKGMAMLEKELALQILPDGGHISRNPALLVELLIDLLPLRQAFIACQLTPPAAIHQAIDRIMPMLRFFRHSDGAFARFNGSGETRRDLLATVMAYDDVHGAPLNKAIYTGYHRLTKGSTHILVDSGKVPPFPHSYDVHASALAFEMSAGGHRFVVNCGVPSRSRKDWRSMARGPAAHSTLIMNDYSYYHFQNGVDSERSSFLADNQFVFDHHKAPKIKYWRDDKQDHVVLRGVHYGYEKRYGYMHERLLCLARAGGLVEGRDRLIQQKNATQNITDDAFTLRFHLHPAVQIDQKDQQILLHCEGEVWAFCCDDLKADIEESIFFSDIHGQQNTNQIVLHGRANHINSVVWQFVRRKTSSFSN